jgi:hypothetical protein
MNTDHRLSDARASKHFTWAELIYSRTARERGISNTPPEETLPLVRDFCRLILEPIRLRFGPTFITSGYRSEILNSLVGGDPGSQHIWTAEHCAVDFQVRATPLQTVFDWLRLESGLPFDVLILERGTLPDSEQDDCIHVSFVRQPRRIALVGATNNRGAYQRVNVA